MLKWKILAVLGLALGVAGIGWGYAQQKKAIGFFELRVYTAQPGKRDALAARFANRTAAIYARHGITNVGYWIPQQSDPELGISAQNTFVYMRGYPSKEERDKRPPTRAQFSGGQRGRGQRGQPELRHFSAGCPLFWSVPVDAM